MIEIFTRFYNQIDPEKRRYVKFIIKDNIFAYEFDDFFYGLRLDEDGFYFTIALYHIRSEIGSQKTYRITLLDSALKQLADEIY